MRKTQLWLVIFVVTAACTCGARTECSGRAQISLLTSIHDDPSCRKLSTKGVLMFEAAKLLIEAHNNKSSIYDLELSVLDTCGSITGALKAAMKALVTADINCLQAPHYLGIIGPDTSTNAEAVHKITSVLKVPHIVKKPSQSPYLHHLAKESDTYLVQGTLKVIEALKWKSFTLVANADDDNDDDVQHIARKLTMDAIAKGLCVIVHDNDEEDYTSHIVHVGKPESGFFTWPVNSTILVVSEGNLEDHLNQVNSSNTILLLEDSRNEFAGLEARVEKSTWWPAGQGAGKYDPEELRDVRWLKDAIQIYGKALDTLCKKKKCRGQINSVDWNNVLSKILESHNAETKGTPKSLDLALKAKGAQLQALGSVLIKATKTKIDWSEDDKNEEDDDDGDADGADDEDDNDGDGIEDEVPEAFKKLLSQEKETRTGCATTVKEIKMLHEDDDEAAHVLVSEMDDSEWWTMVGTVSGVGVAMFVVGILAVYVVYTNIRGPRSPKGSKNRLDRDTTLRRVGSDREMPVARETRSHRLPRLPQRRDSNRSIRSNLSEKSV